MKELNPTGYPRVALLVPGMHRSGTSALSGMLAKLGSQTPKSLMVPTGDNPRGYWEATALMRFHDEVLASAGTVWSDWDRFNPDWAESADAADFVGRLPKILEQEYGDAHLLLIKDPRMGRLLPLWLRVLADLDVTPKFVLPIRHPFEVARSLEVRNDFGRSRSCLMWLRHMLDAELQSRGHDRIFVEYVGLLTDWRTQARRISADLNLKWPKWSASVEADMDLFLSAELRHHHVDSIPSPGGVAAWVDAAYQSLKLLAEDEQHAQARAQLDKLRTELDKSSGVYAAVLRESEFRSDARMQAVRGRLDDASGKYDELASSMEQTLADRDGRIAELQERIARSDGLQEALSGSTAQCKALEERLSESTAQCKALEERLPESTAQCEAMEAKLSEATAQRDSFEAAIAEQTLRHDAKAARLEQAKAETDESLQARFAEIAKLTSMVFELEEVRDTERALHASEVSENAARVAWLEREIELCRRKVEEQQHLLESIRQDAFWKGGERLRRWIGRPSHTSEERPVLADAKAIAQSGLFDRAWYLSRYKDVRKRGMDPLKHYIRYGAAEGRDPGAGFSTRGYLKRYPDVVASGLNPLLHYVRYGIWEGRTGRDSQRGAAER